MINRDALIDLFETMLREKWAYEWGKAQRGLVDCSGAFVYAYRTLGGPAIEHGSNSIARLRAGALMPAEQAQPGWAVFKRRAWRQENRTNRWYDSAPGDLYHIGLMGRDGKVLNAQSVKNGFVASPLDRWSYAAPLNAVDYAVDNERALYDAVVTTQKDPLRVRDAPGTGRVIGSVRKGALVEVLSGGTADWTRIRYENLVGYASSDYLTRVENGDEGDAGETDSPVMVITDSVGHEFRLVGPFTCELRA